MSFRVPLDVRPLWLVVALLSSACGGDGGGGSPTSPPPPTPNPAGASFRLSGASGDQVISYTDGPNLVFCRRAAGWAHLWVRMAAQRSANGEGGPHIDIDLCNDAGGGAFRPMDPRLARCGGDKTWDIWWHDGAGAAFTNAADAPGCELRITANGSELQGSFSCRDLSEQAGARTVDVLEGFFSCTAG